MRKQYLFLLTSLMLLILSSGLASAQDNTPHLTSFATSYERVCREQLLNRAARVPVSWSTANRPVFANLVFEQILPDGERFNVELPRLIPWVASTDEGMAAPIMPGQFEQQIVLSVRLVNLFTNETMDELRINLPISEGNCEGFGSDDLPALVTFASSEAQVNRDLLDAGNARVPVRWEAVNRPLTATLIFEQRLNDGSYVNVELPRDNPWVNSAGQGMVAPVLPGGDNINLVLRVRLIDYVFGGRVYDQLTLSLPIVQEQDPAIRYFSTTTRVVDSGSLADRIAYVDVSWAVDNRHQGTNLVFEQEFQDGSTRNVELPRDNPIVPSSGTGVTRPYPPLLEETENITLILRVVAMNTGRTLDVASIVMPVIHEGDPGDIHDDIPVGQCLSSTFFEPAGLTVGGRGEVVRTISTDTRFIWGQRPGDGGETIGETNIGDTFTVLGGPYCYRHTFASNNQIRFRMWQVEFENRDLTGWVHEFFTGLDGSGYLLLPLSDDNGGGDDDIVCEHDFFIADPQRPDDVCPTGPAETLSAAYLPFTGGFMVWESDTRQVRVAYHDGSYNTYNETWDGSTVYEYPDDIPFNQYGPQRGFGQVYNDNPEIQAKLGWAITPEETGYTMTRQTVDLRDTNNALIGDTYRTIAGDVAVGYSNTVPGTWRNVP